MSKYDETAEPGERRDAQAELPGSPTEVGGLLDIVGDWLKGMSARVGATTSLAAAEARLAGLSIAAMVGAAILMAFLAFAAYLLGMAGIIFALANAGVTPVTSLSLLAVFHAILVVVLWRKIRGLSRNLMFNQTRRQFSQPDPESGTASASTSMHNRVTES